MIRNLWRKYAEISFEKLVVNLTKTPKPKPKDLNSVTFGSVFTDHMLEVNWTESAGWTAPEIKPLQPIKIDPAASVLHYCTECYEGFKAYSHDSHIASFRPDMNMARLHSSAAGLGLPDIHPEELLKCIDELVRVDRSWVPNTRGHSLYIRPNLFGTHAQLSVAKPRAAKLTVIMSPVGLYFPGEVKPLSLYSSDNIIRAWPGGHGHKKFGGNYAVGIMPLEKVRAKGFDQILWLSEGNVTEAGVMNFFSCWKSGSGIELITSPVGNTVLPGVTRDSIIQLCRGWGDIKISEKQLTIKELLAGVDDGRVVEMFGAGTAAMVCPVNLVNYEEKDHFLRYEDGKMGPLTKRLRETLHMIKYGDIKHKWMHFIV